MQEISCEISLVPVNYTDTMAVFPTIMTSSPVVQPTLGLCYIFILGLIARKTVFSFSKRVMLVPVHFATEAT